MTDTSLSKRILFIIFLVLFGILMLVLFKNNIIKISFSNSSQVDITPRTTTYKYKCPSTLEFCVSGKEILKDGVYEGFGLDLQPDSEIVAAIDGKVTVTTSSISNGGKTETVNVIYIDNPTEGLRALYFFKGQTFVGSEVKKGDLMGKVEQKLDVYDTWLLFQTLKRNGNSVQKEQLSVSDFE